MDATELKEQLEKVETSELFESHPSGVTSDVQLAAILLGYFYRATRTRDRRASAVAIGERPKGSMVFDTEKGQFVSDEGEAIMATATINKPTGLPESASALLPKHRALYGWDLALRLVIPPEDWVCSFIYTDELEQNEGLGPDDPAREWQALAYKPKFKPGPRGRPLAEHHCRTCGHEWVAELIDPICISCGERGAIHGVGNKVERFVIDNWSDEEITAVKENTRRLKRVVHALADDGYFNTQPRIDEHATGELGTDKLKHGEDGYTMGFAITESGLTYATEFCEKHPRFARGHSTLDAMGKTLAEKAPQWLRGQRDTDVVER